MDFLRLHINNFLTIGDSGELDLNSKGLVLIQGKNEDDDSATSNGAGKSSIPDALAWALFGITSRGEAGDDVVNNVAKKDCRVRVVLQDGESIYEVTRYRKHKEFKNSTRVHMWNPAATYPTGASVDMSRGTEKETQVMIEGILGCSQEVFLAAIYAGQEAMPDLPNMTDKELKLLVEQAAGVDRLERAYLIARDQENEVATKLSTARSIKAASEARVISVRGTLLAEQAKFDVFESGRAGRKATYQAAALDKANKMRATYADLKGLDEAALKAELSSHQKSLAEHSTLIDKHSKMGAAVTVHERSLASAQANLTREAMEVKRIQAAISNAPAEMAKPCPECGKPHTPEELEEFTKHLRGRLEAQIKKAQEVQAQVNDLNAIVVKATEELHEHNKTIPEVTPVSARVAEINRQIAHIQAVRNGILLLKKEYDSDNAAADRAMTEVNPYKAAIDMGTRQVAELEGAVTAQDSAAALLEGELAIRQGVTKVFSPSGVRALILDTVTPLLNDRTSEYLNALSEGNISAVWSTLGETKGGEIREKFNIAVSNDKGAKRFGGLSGGEKRKVRLATMLALQDLVASRASKPINLWVGDEIDDALDPAGLERLMGILDRKAKERGTVLVISHNQLTDWIDQTVTVTKVGGVSRVEGTLNV